MVNLGRSWGCRMCKQRRIKCDETEDACKRCMKSGIVCPGYDADKQLKIRFKDETASVTHKAGSGRPRGPAPLPPVALQEDFETQAFNFFILNFATAGRDKGSSKGLWENVVPTLNMVSKTSPASDAATAVGGILFNVWRLHRDGPNARNPAFNRAIRGLRTRLESPEPINGPEILMTILLLQFHENIAAVFGLRSASRTHYNGALALIRHLPVTSFSTLESRGLLLNIFNIEVSLAIRECQPFDSDLIPWFASLPYAMPTNPAIKLSCIGISVANIQHRFEVLLKAHPHCPSGPCVHSTEIATLYSEILEFQMESSEWLKSIPEHWMPRTWQLSAEQPDPPIPMYLETCEVYPSVQVASVMNTARGYRLIICKILSIMRTHGWLAPHTQSQTHSPPEETVQSLVDSMCYSIPFYLGNRDGVQYITDLTNPKPRHIYPAYHNMRDPPIAKEHILDQEFHRKHVLAYGTWHSMYPLSLLIALFGKHSGYDCDCLARSLRPGQLAWIGSQLIRMMGLYGLTRRLGATSADDPEMCARAVRRALRCVYQECILMLVGFPDDGASFVMPIQDASSYLEIPESFGVVV